MFRREADRATRSAVRLGDEEVDEDEAQARARACRFAVDDTIALGTKKVGERETARSRRLGREFWGCELAVYILINMHSQGAFSTHDLLAQWKERQTSNLEVAGSIPVKVFLFFFASFLPPRDVSFPNKKETIARPPF